jgi:hypothetical protein
VAQPVKAVNDLAEDIQEGFAVPSPSKLYSERTSHDLAQAIQRPANSKKQELTPHLE